MASRRVSAANADSGKPSAQNAIENGCASMRRTVWALHSKKNSATPQHIHASTGAPPRASTPVPITAGGATVMKVSGSSLSDHTPCTAMRASSSASTTGHSSAPTPNCAADQTGASSATPANGASRLPTAGSKSAGVTAGQPSARPLSALSHRPATHTVAAIWDSEPSHHSAATQGSAPTSQVAAVASRISEIGSAATKAWRTGCDKSPASAAAWCCHRKAENTPSARNSTAATPASTIAPAPAISPIKGTARAQASARPARPMTMANQLSERWRKACELSDAGDMPKSCHAGWRRSSGAGRPRP